MATARRPIPDDLLSTAMRWQQAGRPPQRGSSWSLRSWQDGLPEQSDFLATVPNPIDRASAISLCRRAGDEPAAAVHGFVAAMLWGYGMVGYGPFRTARVLHDNDAAAERLQHAAVLARDDGGPAAFDWLARHRLRWLGVAFATKYLYFCAATGSATPALVLDQLVRDWLADHADWRLSREWNVADYRAYVTTVCAWGVELGLPPPDVEMLIFTLAVAALPASQWSQPDLLAASPPPQQSPYESAEPEARDVLDALDEAGEAFAALAASLPARDVDDFERGLRQLRRIVLTRSQ